MAEYYLTFIGEIDLEFNRIKKSGANIVSANPEYLGMDHDDPFSVKIKVVEIKVVDNEGGLETITK